MLLIAPEGIEIFPCREVLESDLILLIAPEGIEIKFWASGAIMIASLNRTRRNSNEVEVDKGQLDPNLLIAPEGIEIFDQ